MIKLDKHDLDLLYELDLDARQTNKQLAKKLKLSEQAIKYRIDRLLDRGIIQNFLLTTDPSKLGYTHFKLYLKFQNISPEEEQNLIDYLKKQNTFWIVSARGNYDLIISLWAKDVFEFREFYLDFKGKFGSHIYDENFVIVLDVKIYNRTYLNNYLEKKVTPYGGKKQPVELDDIDKDLLRELSNNARLSFVELSRKLKINADTLRYRFSKLKENKTILGSRISINLDKISRNYVIVQIYLHDFDLNTLKKMEEFSENLNGVTYYVTCLGEHNIELELETKDNDETDAIIKAYRDKFFKYIKNYSLITIKKEHKLRFVPF